MYIDRLIKRNIILGSSSPRRKDLLGLIINNFKIMDSKFKEDYPEKLKDKEVSEFLAIKKSDYLLGNIVENDILITADTIVLKGNRVLNKPKNALEAKEMLCLLSDGSHKVITSICIRDQRRMLVFSTITKVFFKPLSNDEITYYINEYKPFDKAGGYGIQEWIGLIGITNIEGSYFNVVGLPISQLYQKLIQFVSL